MSSRFLESINDKFPIQVIEKPMRRGALLNLILTNKEEFIWDVKAEGSLNLQPPRDSGVQDLERREQSKMQDHNLRFYEGKLWPLHRDLCETVPWQIALQGMRSKKVV